MLTFISLAILGILVLLLGVMKRKALLLPLIIAGLLITLAVTISYWDSGKEFYSQMLVFDNTAVAFICILVLSTFLIFSFAAHYYRPVERPLEDVYAVTIFALTGAVMMATFGNLIMLFLGIETLSIALYILAGSHKEAITSNEATLKYFLIGSFISGFLLFGITLIYGSAHSFDMIRISEYIASIDASGQHVPKLFLAGLYLMIIGLAFKIAIVPFHFWAPDVYEGTPTLLTAFMATVVKTASIVALYRLFSVCMCGASPIWETTLAILAALTILLGNFTGLYQPGLKRMLAYSSISHSGYMMLAVVAFGSRSAGTLLLYTLSYSLATITAFGILMLVREVYGNDRFESFNGLAKKNPVEALCLTIAMLSLTGIPPLAGFMAKYYLFATAIDKGFLWLVIIAIIGSAISAGYYFKPIIAMYLKEGDGAVLMVERSYRVHIVLMTLLTVILGLVPFLIAGLI